MLLLKGHAGTGKDVRLLMFAAMTNRPYFSFDCTKWTTESDLSEDLVLEAVDGASQTMRLPSTILNAITTPGGILYLNEFNAMPQQSQTFLHALLDSKRAITLKTSSGKVVRAHPSVLIVGSMNPNYPGTFEPQLATRSRIVSLEIDYPPMKREKEPGDLIAEAPYDASEALRMARSMDSLSDLTYEADIKRNDFVKMWDKYVNGIENGASDPNPTQRYDIEVILALVQFANKLREDFVKVFEKTRDARKALPVTQPITGRELRRCAYALNKIPPEEKANLAGAENVAKVLLEQFYLSHFDKKEDKDKILAAMTAWRVKHRVAA
jgi:MoxR-like ATPase